MGCGCSKRAVALLKAMGYVEEDGWLIFGEHRVTLKDAEKHHTRITVEAVRHRALAWAGRRKDA